MKLMSHYMGRRTRGVRLMAMCSVFVMGGICPLMFSFVFREQYFGNENLGKGLSSNGLVDSITGQVLHHVKMRHLLETNTTTADGSQSTFGATTQESGNDSQGIYPPDIFTLEQKKQGAVILHVLGMIYMFVALAIVCDEFFVPALGVITDKLNLSDDVAGATFMAAGGSAPELFTSLIGVFLAKSDVGTGTIVGSAVFNILFVIGMCATFSRGVLTLTWWPLFRDCFFYSLSLAMLLYFFEDQTIYWYESMCLLLVYLFYVLFMKFNMNVERFVKSHLLRKKVSAINKSERRLSLPHFRNNASMFRHGALQLMLHTLDPLSDETDGVGDKAMKLQSLAKTQPPDDIQTTDGQKGVTQNQQCRQDGTRTNKKTAVSYHNGYVNGDIVIDEPTQITTVSQTCDSPLSLKTTNGIMLNTTNVEPPTNVELTNVEPTSTPQLESENTQNNENTQNMQNTKVNSEHAQDEHRPNGNGVTEETNNVNGAANGGAANGGATNNGEANNGGANNGGANNGGATNGGANNGLHGGMIANGVDQKFEKSTEVLTDNPPGYQGEGDTSPDQQQGLADMEVEEPLDISWPQGWKKRVTYVLVAPLMYLLYFTLPDVRKPESRRWYSVTFIGSILWIAGFSYLMVWWAKEIGDTMGISERVMGMTFLAAGTSIPDLITSVIVARKGLGDMAVSSSVGSNIFDITVGLPFPWLLSAGITGKAISVDSDGMFCSIFLLFGMLILIVVLIAANKWRMTKLMGASMFFFYVIFLTISLLILYDRLPCIIGTS